MSSYLDRSIQLLGEEQIAKLQSKTVLIAGVGGVGGTALSALIRSGIKRVVIVDFDNVDVTNLNRQIMYSSDDIGKSKVDVCEQKIKSLSNDIEVVKHKLFIDDESLSIFDNENIDIIVDAIDKVPSKISLIQYAQKRNIPIIVSLGMGNRLDPEKVMITTLNKTENDPLAKKMRLECRKANLDLKKINVVFSKEDPVKNGNIVSSMMMVPSTAGLLIAKFVILTLL